MHHENTKTPRERIANEVEYVAYKKNCPLLSLCLGAFVVRLFWTQTSFEGLIKGVRKLRKKRTAIRQTRDRSGESPTDQ